MLEETIGSYISNIFNFIVFLSLSLLLFLALFLISRKSKESSRRIRFFKKDPFLLKNLFVFGVIFILLIFSFFLVSNTVTLIDDFGPGRPLYLLASFLFLIILISVYIIKARVLEKGKSEKG